jgi:hypothetical protein
MKKSLFTLCCLFWANFLFGQLKPDKTQTVGTRRIETYFFKKTNYDSLRLTIEGQANTVLEEKFWRNGRFKNKKWSTDSLFSFNNFGLLD